MVDGPVARILRVLLAASAQCKSADFTLLMYVCCCAEEDKERYKGWGDIDK